MAAMAAAAAFASCSANACSVVAAAAASHSSSSNSGDNNEATTATTPKTTTTTTTTTTTKQKNDGNGIIGLEHVFVPAHDYAMRHTLYRVVLGLPLDLLKPAKSGGRDNNWFRIGAHTALHVPYISNGGSSSGNEVMSSSSCLRGGTIGLCMSSAAVNRVALRLLQEQQGQSARSWQSNARWLPASEGKLSSSSQQHLSFDCPFGNRYELYKQPSRSVDGVGTMSLRCLRFRCAPGTAAQIGAFYAHFLGAHVEVIHNNATAAAVRIYISAANQHLDFVEDDDAKAATAASLTSANTDNKSTIRSHICLYVADWRGLFDKLEASHDGVHTRSSRTIVPHTQTTAQKLAYSCRKQQFWFRDIVSVASPHTVLFRLEHEIRSTRHVLGPRPWRRHGLHRAAL
jgi:hypothetical protein